MKYLGDIVPGQVLRFLWETAGLSGQSITRATDGTISVYKDNGATQTTTGVSGTEDFDSLTGIHSCAIDTSADGTFYSAGSDFAVVLSGAVIDGQTVNAVLAHFSIANRSALRPTTAGRTLDVSATGEAGIDLANVGSPTTALNLSGTTIKEVTDAAAREVTIAGYLDTEIASIKAITDTLVLADIADAVLDEAVEGSVTLRESVRLANAALGGKASGLDGTSPVYRDLADTKDRLSATVDSDGNRTAVTRDLT